MMKKIILVLAVVLIFVAAVPVYAQLGNAIGNLKQVGGGTGLQSDLPTSVGTIIKATLSLLGTIFLVLMVYAGVLWMTAGGTEDRIEKAKKIITACIIGLAITMSAYAITYFVTTKLSGSTAGTGTDSGDIGCCRFSGQGLGEGSRTTQATCGGDWTPGSC